MLGIMAALRPLVNPKIAKKGTKKFIRHSQTDMSKLSATGGNPEALTIGYAEDSGPNLDAQHWLREQQENKAQAA